MIAVDTNLLLLYIVGLISPEFIERHKRLDEYRKENLPLLVDHIGTRRVLLTPNTASEVSNLIIFGVAEPLRSELRAGLAYFITLQSEIYVPSQQASNDKFFVELGLTDCALLEACASKNAALITVDVKLYIEASRRGIEAINFNHLRDPML